MNCAFHAMNTAVVRCNCCARPLCPACDHRVRGFPFCQECIVAGVEMLQQHSERRLAAPVMRRKSSSFVALLLSFLVPGLGAAYNGQTSKALVHFAIFASFFQIAVISDGRLFFVLGVLATLLFAAVDAYRTAQLIRAGLAPETELDAISRRLYGNPLAWGVLLLTLGTVFLLHTIFRIELPMRQFLAVTIVLTGAYMLYDYVQTRRRRRALAFDSNNPPPSVVGSGNLIGIGGAQTQVGISPRFQTGEIATQVVPRQGGSRAGDVRLL